MTTCPNCDALLVPGLGCCAARATAIAKGHRAPVIAQRRIGPAPLPKDMTTAVGPGAHANVRYQPNAQTMRVPKRDRNVGYGRDNYAMARNTHLLHTHWVPSANS